MSKAELKCFLFHLGVDGSLFPGKATTTRPTSAFLRMTSPMIMITNATSQEFSCGSCCARGFCLSLVCTTSISTLSVEHRIASDARFACINTFSTHFRLPSISLLSSLYTSRLNMNATISMYARDLLIEGVDPCKASTHI